MSDLGIAVITILVLFIRQEWREAAFRKERAEWTRERMRYIERIIHTTMDDDDEDGKDEVLRYGDEIEFEMDHDSLSNGGSFRQFHGH